MALLRAEAIRTLAYGSIGATYALVGDRFANPVIILKIYNDTNANLYFSYDNVVNHEMLPPNGFTLLDVRANKENRSALSFSEFTGISVKRLGTPTAGSVYVSCYYQKG